jgi:hypothetical protein
MGDDVVGSGMSPKDPCVKSLVPVLTLLEGGGTFKRWGPSRRSSS